MTRRPPSRFATASCPRSRPRAQAARRTVLKAAGISRHLVWHDLRHKGATALLGGFFGHKRRLEEIRQLLAGPNARQLGGGATARSSGAHGGARARCVDVRTGAACCDRTAGEPAGRASRLALRLADIVDPVAPVPPVASRTTDAQQSHEGSTVENTARRHGSPADEPMETEAYDELVAIFGST